MKANGKRLPLWVWMTLIAAMALWLSIIRSNIDHLPISTPLPVGQQVETVPYAMCRTGPDGYELWRGTRCVVLMDELIPTPGRKVRLRVVEGKHEGLILSLHRKDLRVP